MAPTLEVAGAIQQKTPATRVRGEYGETLLPLCASYYISEPPFGNDTPNGAKVVDDARCPL